MATRSDTANALIAETKEKYVDFWNHKWAPTDSMIGSIGLFLSLVSVDDKTYTVMVDQGGVVPSRDTFENIVSDCLEFYEVADREAIDDLNWRTLSMIGRKGIVQGSISKPESKSGIVYLLKSGEHYKIGLSKSTNRRMMDISPKLPIEPRLIHTIQTKDMYDLEATFHEHFKEKRTNGEWFLLTENDVEWIKSYPHNYHSVDAGKGTNG